MRELSLHILDIAQNSISAEATVIELEVNENIKNDLLTIRISDNGRGMDEETAKRVVDPFYTSRTTRKVGLGIPMFKNNAEMCDGTFELNSTLGVGTEVFATFKYSHIDRVPLGNMPETIMALVMSDLKTDIYYKHIYQNKDFVFSTIEIKKVLGHDVPLSEVEVLLWIKDYVAEGIKDLKSNT